MGERVRGAGRITSGWMLLTVTLLAAGCTSSGSNAVVTSAPASGVPPASPSVASTPTPPPSLIDARLAGKYVVHLTAARNTFSGKGGVARQEMKFAPTCAQGACATILSGTMHYVQAKYDDKYTVKLGHLGRSYAGLVNGYFATCDTKPVKDKWTFTIKVERAATINGVWIARKWDGTWTRDSGAGGLCSASRYKAILHGTLESG